MIEYKSSTCKVYRLIDPCYPSKHENHVRYVGITCGKLKERLSGHNNHCSSAVLRQDWFNAPVFEIQLVEPTDTRREAKLRECYWVELHQRAGYNLLNVHLIHGTVPLNEPRNLAQAKEDIESEIEGLVPESLRESRRESDERLQVIEQDIYALIKSGQVSGEDADFLLQALGKA